MTLTSLHNRLDPDWQPPCELVMTNDMIAADRPRWLTERRHDPETGAWRLTASEMAAVIGVAPESHDDGSPYALYRAKLTGESGFAGSDRTDFGLFCEPFVSDRFARMHDELQLGDGGLYVSTKWPWLGATFDRVAYDPIDVLPGDDHAATYVPVAPVQIKTWAEAARWQWGPAGTGEVPVHIRVQCMIELAVLGTDRIYLPVLWLPSSRVDVYEIERDDVQIAALVAAGQEFIGLLDAETPPDVDWSDATTGALKRQFTRYDDDDVRIPAELAARYVAAGKAEKRAKQRRQQAGNEIRARLGNAARAVALDADGLVRKVVTRSGGPRAGYSVDPQEWVETMRPATGRDAWGK